MPTLRVLMMLCVWVSLSGVGEEVDEAAALAKKLANPVASLISIPIEVDFDDDLGSGNSGDRLTVTAKPVVPVSLNEDWNLITRAIVPFADVDFGPGVSASGLSDIVPTFFLSPTQPTSGGWIWGAGPVFVLPTATDDLVGGEKWGAGPSAVFLKQQGQWTYGLLANHLWSFAGEDDRTDINATFVQPFVSYNTSNAWTLALQTETTRDWESDEWNVPVNFTVSKLSRVGKVPVQYRAGLRYWVDAPDAGPLGFGFKLAVVVLLPK